MANWAWLKRWLGQNLELIDVVYTWVDGADPEFQRELDHYTRTEPTQDVSIAGERRFRNSEELRYSLRSLETNVPWAGRVFLVTNGQVPPWLRRDHPRLQLVDHRDIFLNPAHLPTFNSAAIETHLHRIPGLARRFLSVNDDVFFGNAVVPGDFLSLFGRVKIRVDPWTLPESRTKGDLMSRSLAYNRDLLRGAFGNREFSSVAHTPILLDRDVLARMEAKWPDEFERTSAHRFRTEEMIFVHVLYTHFLAAQEGCELVALSAENYPFVMFQPPLEKTLKALEKVRREQPSFFCINDDWDADGETKNRILTEFLEDYFPEPSSFERKEGSRLPQ